MANGNEHKDDKGSSVWDRLNQHGDQISELARSQAIIEANLAALAQSVDAGFTNLNKAVTRFAERESRPTNWLAVGLGIIGILGFLITFVTLVVSPLDARLVLVETNERENRTELADRAFLIGRTAADVEWLKSAVNREQDRDK